MLHLGNSSLFGHFYGIKIKYLPNNMIQFIKYNDAVVEFQPPFFLLLTLIKRKTSMVSFIENCNVFS